MVIATDGGRDAPHEGEGFPHTGHRILGLDLVLEIDIPLVTDGAELPENLGDGHLPFPYYALAVGRVEVAQILGVHVVDARSRSGNGADRVCARPYSMTEVDAQSHERIHPLDRLQRVER